MFTIKKALELDISASLKEKIAKYPSDSVIFLSEDSPELLVIPRGEYEEWFRRMKSLEEPWFKVSAKYEVED